MQRDFREIKHCGGCVSFYFERDAQNNFFYSFGYSSSAPNPVSLAGFWFHSNGLPAGTFSLPGMGAAADPAPHNDCVPILVASDSEGLFGHVCPSCSGYWRSGPFASYCPYCRSAFSPEQCLSVAQIRYSQHYIEAFLEHYQKAFSDLSVGEKVQIDLDMDVFADRIGNPDDRFSYFSEESQQNRFQCGSCSTTVDIIGRFGYCSMCRRRNQLDYVNGEIASLRSSMNDNSAPPETVLCKSVSMFDAFFRQYTGELVKHVPLSARRKGLFGSRSYHSFGSTCSDIKDAFDIDIGEGRSNSEVHLIEMLFERRHLHEHNAGVVDQRYLDKTKDQSVRLQQQLREDRGQVHALLSLLSQIFVKGDEEFHELLPSVKR